MSYKFNGEYARGPVLCKACRSHHNTSSRSWACASKAHVTDLTHLQSTCCSINTSLCVFFFKCVTENSSHIVLINPLHSFTVMRFSTGHLDCLVMRQHVCFTDKNISFYLYSCSCGQIKICLIDLPLKLISFCLFKNIISKGLSK